MMIINSISELEDINIKLKPYIHVFPDSLVASVTAKGIAGIPDGVYFLIEHYLS